MRHLRPLLTSLLLLTATIPIVRAEQTPSADPAIAQAAKPHHVYLIGQLRVMQPWIDIDGGSTDRAEAYVVVENRGESPERLTGARTEGADHIAIALKDGQDDAPGASVTIPPRTTVTLKPDDTHLVLEGLHGDVRGRDKVPGVLVFERAGSLPIQFATNHGAALREDQTDPSTDVPTSLVK